MPAILLSASAVHPSAYAQLGPLPDPSQAPQAQTQDEFDAYLQITTQSDGHEIIRQVDRFASNFPRSQFLGIAYQYEMHACQQLGDIDGMMHAGRKALVANPGNLNTLLTLAPALANAATARPDRKELLEQAQQYAEEALSGLEKARIPREMPPEQWITEKRNMQSEVHETLGVVALGRSKIPDAITEFETAIRLRSKADGAQFLRLALAYIEGGRSKEARANLERAAELGPDNVRAIATEQIRKLNGVNPPPN